MAEPRRSRWSARGPRRAWSALPRDAAPVRAAPPPPGRAPSSVDGRPLRITILGNSQAVMCSPSGGPRSDRTYAQWLRRFPTRLGTTISVVNASYEVADARHGEALVSSLADRPRPDVLVLHLGTSEAFSAATPHWLWHLFLGSERHAGWHHRAFERARPRLWLVLRAYQRRVDRWLGVRGGRVSPRRFERDVRRIVLDARSGTDPPLVLLVDVVPLERIARNTPNAPDRLRLMQETLVRVVDELDDAGVKLVSIRPIVEAAGGVGEAMPDGYHFTPDVHRQIAELLWEAVSAWEEQRHGAASTGSGGAREEREPPLRISVIAARDLTPVGEGEGRSTSYPSLLSGSDVGAGGPPEVFTVSRPGADVRLAIDAFQPAVQQVTPDVVVIDAGTGGGRLSSDRLRRELLIAIPLARRVSSPLVLIVDDPDDDRQRARGGRSRDASWAVESAVGSHSTDEVRRLQLPASAGSPGPDRKGERGRLTEAAHHQLATRIAAEIRAWQQRASSGSP